MALTFGKKKSEIKESDGNYIRRFRDGETKVRFLQEPDDWWGYRQHYAGRRSYPCTEDYDTCPGCNSDTDAERRASRRYGTFVWLVNDDRVVPFELGAKLADRLIRRAERNDGTLLSRDYLVVRSGKDLATEYEVEQDERYPVDIAGLWARRGEFSIEDLLNKSYDEVHGDTQDKPKAKPVEDKVPDSLKSKEEKAKPADNDDEVDEATLRGMTRAQLKEIFEKAGFTGWDDDWTRGEIIDSLLAQADAA